METSSETNKLLEDIREELIKIVGQGSEHEEESAPVEVVKQDKLEADEDDISTGIGINELASKDPFMSALHCDVQKIQMNLDKTYALFRTVGDRFASIDFSALDQHIKDLNLHHNDGNDKAPLASRQLRDMFEKSFRDKTLNKLTENVTKQFRTHPGEFGDIAEVSNFFQTCTQLQHGLDEMRAQGNNAQELGERLEKATEEKYQRMEEISKILEKSKSTN